MEEIRLSALLKADEEKLRETHPIALTTLLTLLSRLSEKGFVEIEDSPIEDGVVRLALVQVVHPEGGMAVETVDLLMGRTGNQRKLHTVHICQSIIFLSL